MPDTRGLKLGDRGGHLQLNAVALQQQMPHPARFAVERSVDAAPTGVPGFERVNAEQLVARADVLD